MPVSKRRKETKGFQINNRNYPLIVTAHVGSFSVTTRRNQIIQLGNGKAKQIEHYRVVR